MIKPEDIEVPEWLKGLYFDHGLREILAALANNPIVPTAEETAALYAAWDANSQGINFTPFVCTEWQRRMFLRKRNPTLTALMADPTPEKVLAAYELGKTEGK